MRQTLLLVRLLTVGVAACVLVACGSQPQGRSTFTARASADEIDFKTNVETGAGLEAPIRLEADGEPIDIGKLSSIAHAGPWIADVDSDGDRDLLVGDFPGYFWLFDNIGSDSQPQYASKGKLQAGGEDAKTPVY